METDRNALTYGTKWTPVKRLHAMRDSMPEEARSSVAWTGTLPLPSEPTLDMHGGGSHVMAILAMNRTVRTMRLAEFHCPCAEPDQFLQSVHNLRSMRLADF